MIKKLCLFLLLIIQLIVSKSLFAATVKVYALEAMPFCGISEGKPVGIAVDILNKATDYGAPTFKLDFHTPWIRATRKIQESKDELIAIIPFTRSSIREDKYKWVAEIMATEYRFYTFGQFPPLKSISEINGEKIGVVHGHAIIPMLNEIGLSLDSGAKTAQKNAMKLLYKRVHIIADSDVIAMYSWKQIGQNANDLQIGPSIGDVKHVYIATGPNFPDEIAKSIFNAIEQMKKTGELQKIYDKWLY
ncbi:substrate-binding periplasmic protein [Vibrio sp. HA2012]|uniref:substrate-binding periplasmic protein n=1 Tax=Vibrio sp. HA2012 TaxID=1971595 RepID=UPI0012FDFBDE|nr:ABC transporter substrate-binding protein [Vibrio sp. HA2012]